jgi:hypothetical protein
MKNRLNTIIKTEYKKQGVIVAVVSLTDIDGFAFETKDESDKPIKGILINGKLRRTERRKLVKILLHALNVNYLGDFPQFGANVRGAVVHSVNDLR